MNFEFRFPDKPDWGFLFETYGPSELIKAAPLLAVVDYCSNKQAYLAIPYSKIAVNPYQIWCPVRSDGAGQEAARWAAMCAVNKLSVVSPIITAVEMLNADSGHAIDPLDATFWTAWCRPILQASGAVVIPPIDGWTQSQGIWDEACWALRHNVPVYLITEGSKREVAA